MGEQFVKTSDIKNAVKGREAEVLAALGIAWERGRPHIDCPYPTHGGKLDWRWEPKEAKAFCTCSTKGDSIFDVVSKVESLGEGKTGFEAAKLRVAEILGRADFIQEPGASTGSTTADGLLNRPTAERNDDLPATYLAARLGVAVADLVQPSTRTVGLRELGYYDPPATDGGKPHLVGKFACAVFETVAADGKKHAHRIYLAADGKAKAALGKRADGKERNPKKAAKRLEGDTISGRSVLFGDAGRAEHLVVAEGIETAAAVAYAFKAEVQVGAVAVAAAISAVGVEAVKPWPGTKRIAVAADRDEAMKGLRPGTRRGEQAARVLAARLNGVVPVSMALPGEAGQSVDWLDILRTNGANQVRASLLGAELVVPSADDLAAASGQQRTTERKAELEAYAEAYPLPELHGLRLALRTTHAGKVKVHRIIETTDPETGEVQEKAVPVATPFGVKALLRYADKADSYGLRVVVEDMKGNPRAVDFERSALARMGANDIKAELFAAGLRVEGKGDDYAVQALKAADPTEEIVVVSRPGWHTLPPHAEPVFVAPSGVVVGTAPVQVELAMGNRQIAPLQAGTMDGWKEAAAAALGGSNVPHWTLGIAAGFAGVLVSLTGLDTCGINLSGMSSAGKTTAQRLAVSVWSSVGIGVGLLQSMRSTENAVEALARLWCANHRYRQTGREALSVACPQAARDEIGMPSRVIRLITAQPVRASAFCPGRLRARKRLPIRVL
jgi:Domain of unknown function (DUF927)/Toprim domain